MSNLVQVGTVVVLTTGHTTTTWMLAVLSYTTVSGRDVAATVKREHVSPCVVFRGIEQEFFESQRRSNMMPENPTIRPY